MSDVNSPLGIACAAVARRSSRYDKYRVTRKKVKHIFSVNICSVACARGRSTTVLHVDVQTRSVTGRVTRQVNGSATKPTTITAFQIFQILYRLVMELIMTTRLVIKLLQKNTMVFIV